MTINNNSVENHYSIILDTFTENDYRNFWEKEGLVGIFLLYTRISTFVLKKVVFLSKVEISNIQSRSLETENKEILIPKTSITKISKGDFALAQPANAAGIYTIKLLAITGRGFK